MTRPPTPGRTTASQLLVVTVILSAACMSASVLGAVSLGTAASAATPPSVVPPPRVSPTEYARIALDFIENESIRVGDVNWPSVRRAAERRAASARSIRDVHPAITAALRGLGDRHSSFQPPPDARRLEEGRYTGFGFLAVWPSRNVVTVTPGGPGDVAGLKVGDRIELVNGRSPRHQGNVIAIPRGASGGAPASLRLTVTRKGVRKTLTLKVAELTLVSTPQAAPAVALAAGRAIGAKVGYVELPGVVGDARVLERFAIETHAAIKLTDSPPRCGWIVDLRRNRGGYLYPMLAGIGPLLGSDAAGGTRNAKGTVLQFRYDKGKLFGGTDVFFELREPYVPPNNGAPVAVLTSAITASAGEAIAISFVGRAATRSFGESTVGLTTANVQMSLPDGATLIVTNAVDVDRSGRSYDGPVVPDELVKVDWNRVGTPDDPVIAKALTWLEAQPACA